MLSEVSQNTVADWRVALDDVSCGEFGEFLVAGQRGGEAEEGEEVAAFALVPNSEAAEAEEPGDGAFDLPPVSAESLGRLDAWAGDAGDDATFPQPGQGVGGVVRLVGAELAGTRATRSASGSYGRDRFHQGFEGLAVVGVRPGHADRQWDAPSLGQHVQFAAGFAAVDRIAPGQRTPLFARTEAASMIAEDQSSSPRAPSSSSTAR
jgi:hypothetical protein